MAEQPKSTGKGAFIRPISGGGTRERHINEHLRLVNDVIASAVGQKLSVDSCFQSLDEFLSAVKSFSRESMLELKIGSFLYSTAFRIC